MAWPPSEVAKLTVNGQNFTEWESVWVQERWTESFSFFRFTANEGRVMPGTWQELQVKPGDDCTISLGGQKIIAGTVITRQASYSGNQHMVQLTGKSYSFWAYKSSVFTEDGNFDGKNFVQIADIVLGPVAAKGAIVGTPNPEPFKKAQADKGMKIWDYLEKLAREKKIQIGSNRQGMPLFIGDHVGKIIGTVTEGDNILACQCTITCEDLFMDINVDAQNQGDDQNSGTDASEIRGHASSKAPRPSVLLIPMEHPPNNENSATLRAYYEKVWTEATQITCNVTVQGWFAQNGGLWEAGQDVMVVSPMAMIRDVMKIKTATFAQDNNAGTTTTLECVAPWGLLDNINANVGAPKKSSVAPAPSPDVPPTIQPAPTGSQPPPTTPPVEIPPFPIQPGGA
jgi:prophage tail gpP-like protein